MDNKTFIFVSGFIANTLLLVCQTILINLLENIFHRSIYSKNLRKIKRYRDIFGEVKNEKRSLFDYILSEDFTASWISTLIISYKILKYLFRTIKEQFFLKRPDKVEEILSPIYHNPQIKAEHVLARFIGSAVVYLGVEHTKETLAQEILIEQERTFGCLHLKEVFDSLLKLNLISSTIIEGSRHIVRETLSIEEAELHQKYYEAGLDPDYTNWDEAV